MGGSVSNTGSVILTRASSIFDRASPLMRAVNIAGAVALLLIVALTFVDVFLRYVFSRPLVGGIELVEFGMILIVFLGGAYCQLHKTHVGIDLIIKRLSAKGQVVINSITHILYVGMLVLIIYHSTMDSLFIMHEGQLTTTMRIPIAPVAFIVPFGCLLLLIVVLRDLFNYLTEGLRLQLGKARWVLLFGIVVLLMAGMVFWISPTLWGISSVLAGLIGMIVMLLFLFTGMPVAFVLIIIGFLGLARICGLDPGFHMIGVTYYETVASYTWACIPFFVLMGFLCFFAAFSEDLYSSAYKWIGHFPGGLAMSTTAACAAFAAVVGDVLSATLSMGAVSLPEMRRYKYSDTLATGVVAAGGTLGPLIPPSIGFIIYAILADQSIGKLFIAGILPGILLAGLWMSMIYIRCRLNPKMGPPGARASWGPRLISLKAVGPILILFLLVIGGIYGGLFTPTEGGAIGAAGALIVGLAMRRFNRQRIIGAFLEAGKVSSMSFFILGGAMVFSYFLAASQLPQVLSEFIATLAVPPIVVVITMLIVLLILGCVMPSLPMIMITVPIFAPLAASLGYDLIWFGVLMVLMMNLACITPPYGINLFVLTAVAKDVPIGVVFRGVIPFVIGGVVCVAIIVAFPQIATWLPYLLR